MGKDQSTCTSLSSAAMKIDFITSMISGWLPYPKHCSSMSACFTMCLVRVVISKVENSRQQ